MPIFASTTTSGYSDPLKAQSIKALEQRYKDMLAQQAPGITPENTQTPIQGFGHLANQLGDSFQQQRTLQAAADQRNALAATMAGIDWEKGPTSQQIAGLNADPELMKQVLTTLAENRRAAAQNETQRYQSDQSAGAQRYSSDQSSGATRYSADQQLAAAQGTQAVTREGHGVQKEIASAGNQLQLDLQSNAALAKREERIAERDFTAAENRLAEAAKLGQIDKTGQLEAARDAARQKYEDAKLKSTQTFEAEQADKSRTATATNQKTQIDATAAENAKTRSAEEIRLRLKIESDEKQANAAAVAKAASEHADPKRIAAITEMGSTYVSHAQAVEKLKKAQWILDNGGIYTGPWARAETAAAMISSGKFGTDLDMAQRTKDFNAIMDERAISQMVNTLKGQSTNAEMDKFIEVLNNPSASPEHRREALGRLIAASEIDRDLHAAGLKQAGGENALNIINARLGKGSQAGAGAGSAGAGGPLQDAQNAINQGADFNAVVKRLQDAGISAAGLKQKGM